MGVSPAYAVQSIAKMFLKEAKKFYSNPKNVKAFEEWYLQKYGKPYVPMEVNYEN